MCKIKLEEKAKVSLVGGWNDYLVIHADDKYAVLKCVLFVRTEDLGDKIMCTRLGQEMWIAQFHAWKYENSAW